MKEHSVYNVGRFMIGRAAWIVACLATGVACAGEEAPDTLSKLYQDSLSTNELRRVGKPLAGAALERGGVKWLSSKGVSLSDSGVTASSPGGFHHATPAVAGTIRLEADVDGKGSGFTGLALGIGDLSGNFWKNLVLMYWISDRNYDVVLGTGAKSLSPKKVGGLVHSGEFNHLELLLDTISRTVTARLNGTTVLDSVALPNNVPLSGISAAGFRFNEPLSAGLPRVKNYRSEFVSKACANFVPADLGTCYVDPDKPATLHWQVGSMGPNPSAPYLIRGYDGQSVASGTVSVVSGNVATLSRVFPAGYSEVIFPEASQTFGIVALPAQTGTADPFFCMDAALSWLEPNLDRRAALVKILARCGVAMARERLGGSSVNNAKGKYNWEAGRNFDSVRKMYAESRVQVLEILDDYGAHLGAAGTPRNYPEMAAARAEFAKHWTIWGAAEASNEPDLKPEPADRYVPLVKTMSYAFAQIPSRLPVVAGALATIPPGPYFDTCAANGMLEDCDALSFHSYDRAASVEGMVVRYRAWLKTSGKEAMPLWHTECGWAWGVGPERPPRDQDALSAMEISAKAMESLACGIATYFPFVYVYYEEGAKNFGMMGREGTPLRSMAAYAACIQALSGKKYLGDLQGLDNSVKLARVFGGATGDECVAVIYTGAVDPRATIPFAIKAAKVTGADGRTLPFADGRLPIPDGVAYVWMSRAEIGQSLKTDTTAMSLYRIGQEPLVQTRRASPILLQFVANLTPSRASARRYLVTPDVARELPVTIRVHNLSQDAIKFTPEITLPGEPVQKAATIMVPAMGYNDTEWKLEASSALDIAQTRFISVCGKAEGVIQPLPVAIPIVMEGSLDQHLKRHKAQFPLPITDLIRWTANIGGGTSKFSAPGEGVFRMDTSPLKWTYPHFTLPEKIDPAVYSGFLMRARILKKAGTIAMIAGSGGEAPSFWVSDLFPADGEWHVVYVPFAEFKPGPGGAGNQNTRLRPELWTTLDVGFGNSGEPNVLEISHLILTGGSGD